MYFCDDFSGMNYAVHAKAKVTSRAPNSVIALIAHMDSLSMFERSAVNARGSLASTALLVSVMALLMAQPEFEVALGGAIAGS